MVDPSGWYVGLISGTSADGIDAVVARFPAPGQIDIAAAQMTPWPDDLRQQIIAFARQRAQVNIDDVALLDARIGLKFAAAAESVIAASALPRSAIRAIGSHGQTLRHRIDLAPPWTLQIGDPSRIVERTGITTVADFRRRDVAAQGQGAPLLPALHATLFSDPDEDRAVLNLGGIANLTLLPRASGTVRGFDTGPANCLSDQVLASERGAACDLDGALARSGLVCESLLAAMLADPYFAQPIPKSTGREYFNQDWLQRHLALAAPIELADLLATLIALSARSIAHALRLTQATTRRVIVCGGGVHNPTLLDALAAALDPIELTSSARFGLDPDFVEAAGFAWLARQTLAGLPGNLASVTGAAGPRILGAIWPA